MSCAHLKNNQWFLCTCDFFSCWLLWALLHIWELSPPQFTEIRSLTLSLLLCSECWAHVNLTASFQSRVQLHVDTTHKSRVILSALSFIPYWITQSLMKAVIYFIHTISYLYNNHVIQFLISYCYQAHQSCICTRQNTRCEESSLDQGILLYTHSQAWCHCSRYTSSAWVRPHRESIVQFWDLQ